VYEIRTSAVQSYFLSRYARTLNYTIESGQSDQILFPTDGPFDQRRGYSQIPIYQERLRQQGFQVTEQSRFSPELMQAVQWGLNPPYKEPSGAGLEIRDAWEQPIYRAQRPDFFFNSYHEIPELIRRSLTFIENRALLEVKDPRSNPALEWPRLARAIFMQITKRFGFSAEGPGASTLAVQIQKYKHSPKGRTDSIKEKFLQMMSASLRAYREDRDTTLERQEILLEYLNSMPLGAAPGYGDVYGLGEGLYAHFGMNLRDVITALSEDESSPESELSRAVAFKHAMALITAVQAPTRYLGQQRSELEARINRFLSLLEQEGILEASFAAEVRKVPLQFLDHAPTDSTVSFVERKAVNAIRSELLTLLDLPDFHTLDRLQLEVDSTLDAELQSKVISLFENLRDPSFIAAAGLRQDRLLLRGDPSKVLYSVLLMERTEVGNVLRVQADNLDRPFDLNEGMKLELGSTAKLRTLAHYLEVISLLYDQYRLQASEKMVSYPDPLTRWAVQTLQRNPTLGLEQFLQLALERRYSANPNEAFFTGGGRHYFSNFDSKDNGRYFTVEEAFHKSTNLVFIRLMRDLVRFHEARLPFDPETILTEVDHPLRRQILEIIAEEEAHLFLERFFQRYRGKDRDEIISRLLGNRAQSVRPLAIVYASWFPDADPGRLVNWMASRGIQVSENTAISLLQNYQKPFFNIADYGYLLSRHPLEVWVAGQIFLQPTITWEELLERSDRARADASAWLFKTRNQRAQDLRLRIWIEKEAFRSMEPFWKRLGFGFDRLVPSYASAIGSASDRPAALAELIGIIINDGVRYQPRKIERLVFARATPYHTVFQPSPDAGERVLKPEVARALRDALGGVVERGTARRLAGEAARYEAITTMIGGKTGSGDNRYHRFSRGGELVDSHVMNRTATFVFFIDDRYYGVITALVDGPEAARYDFTSALPVTLLKMLLPDILSSDLQPKVMTSGA